MSRYGLINTVINLAYELTNDKIHNDIHKQHKFRREFVNKNEKLSFNEKEDAVKVLLQIYDSDKVLFKSGETRLCGNCKKNCLASLYCEYCVQNYLKSNYYTWTSGNNDIDNLIRKCQSETLKPDMVVEWIPYDKLENINYLTKGGCSEIYSADWIDGQYEEWDSKEQLLKRFGKQKVIVKKLENFKSADRSWFEEAKSHLSICNKWMNIVQCYGITQDPNGDYMLVMIKMDTDLRNYLIVKRGKLTWFEKFKAVINICSAINKLHNNENAIHRDLHSGNVLYSEEEHYWYISDLGFCGSANKPLRSIYGNLPYIAPEVIVGKKHTAESDIYSIGMLMWEISSGQPPFYGYYHDFYLVLKITAGMRPPIVSGTPSEYKELMEQCWDANPKNRPKIETLLDAIKGINKKFREKNNNESFQHDLNDKNNTLKVYTNNSKISELLIKSKMHRFEDLPEPKNASEEEQKGN
ncbi:Cmk2p [Rhizophagus irregularis DAOM 197198w]|uniref:Cmk2p n=1 Tax=Rhizophagus irregularis (strain DAOM 197198w) TaxID=1432141 RepID=A0A015K8T6_RHIIW|nr:Cmk2p [Rhizophagus irregularis DAOM 197198w]